MFGKNKVTKPRYGDDRLRVYEVFKTIQGEGPFAGQAATFIRFEGCNLRCYWCDTDFTGVKKTETGGHYLPSELVAKCLTGPTLVVLTGGEPCIQNIAPLVEQLQSKGKTVQIETAGTVTAPGLQQLQPHIVISPKTKYINGNWIDFKHVSYKYIIDVADVHGKDGLPMSSTQVEGKEVTIAKPAHPTLRPNRVVYVQPRDNHRQSANMALCAELVMKHGYILSLQQHKIIGAP